ncbi:MAG: SRPBCC family protein [Bacteroidetes bacterium]|nr:SRPBCC family protein [Bacteroidota bacterium]
MAKEIIVEKSIIIDKPSLEVFNLLKITKNQENFSVWNMKDPNKETTSTGTDGTVGFNYTWNSKNNSVGAGSQKIITLIEGELIEYDLKFERPMKNVGKSKFAIQSLSSTQTKVTWTFLGPTKFPMSLFKRIFQKMLGKDIIQSLENLKILLEK